MKVKTVRKSVVMGIVAIAVMAGAQDGAWQATTSGNWDDPANWIGGQIPGTSGIAYFTNTIPANVTVTLPTTPVEVSKLVFWTNDVTPPPSPREWTFQSGVFTNLSWIEASPWPISNAHKVVFLSRFDGDDPNASLTILGSTSNAVGEIWLCVSNGYRGTTYIGNTARVIISNAWAFGSPESPTVISNGAGVKLRGSITLDEPFLILGNGNTQWSGAIDSQEGTNTLRAMVTLGTGGTRLGATGGGAALVVAGGATGNVGLALQASSLIIITNNPILIFGNQLSSHSGGRTIIAVGSNSAATVEIAHNNTLVLQVHNAFTNLNLLRLGTSGVGFRGTLDMNGYNLTVGQLNHAGGITNASVCAITSAAPAMLTVNQSANTTVTNLWRGPIVLVKGMGGTLSLMGTNLLTGGILITGGTLRVGHPELVEWIRVPLVAPVTNYAAFEILAPGLVSSTNVFVGTGVNRYYGADGLLRLTMDSPDFTGTWEVRTGAVLATTSYALGAHNAGAVYVNYQGGPHGSRALWLAGDIGITGKIAYTSGGGFTNISSQATIPGAGDWTNTVPLGPGAIRSLSGTNVWAGNVVMTAGAGSTYLAADAGAGLIVHGTVYASDTDRVLFLDGAGVGVLRGVISNGATVNLPITKQGSGMWTIAATNQAGGTLTIASGILRIGEGGTVGNLTSGNVVNHGRLVFDRSDTYVVNNLISGSGELIQAGTGTTVLNANNTYTGGTTVSNGTLLVNGAYSGAGLITVDGGTLGGNGSVAGVVVNSGGKLAPGSSTGILAAYGSVTLNNGAAFEVELNGLTAGSDYDQLFLGGTALTLNSPTLNVLLGFGPSVGDTFTIVAGFSSLSGTFNGLPNDSTFTVGGTEFKINYNSSDITLTVVPEPTTVGTLLLGSVVLLLRRRLRC